MESAADMRGRYRRRALLIGAGAGLAAAAVILLLGALESSGAGGALAPSNCGSGLADENLAYVTYVESNVAESGANSVMLIPYAAGSLKPLPISQCSTDGSGSADLSDSGVLDADGQVIIDRRRRLLLAVNQGSDTIAVFRIAPSGALSAVPGSPFPSGGIAPTSLRIAGHTLVVVNKAFDGVRDLTAQDPDIVTFTVHDSGALTPVPDSKFVLAPRSNPTGVFVPAGSRVAIATDRAGYLNGLRIGGDGVLHQGPNSPLKPDPAIFGPGFDPNNVFPLGVAARADLGLAYISMPAGPKLAVYSYAKSGRLTYRSSVPVTGAFLPCWVQITPDGRYLYTANADTENLTAFEIGQHPLHPRQIQTVEIGPGNPWNEEIDPSGRYLFVNTPRDTTKVAAGEGNTQHLLRIGDDGKLTELRSSPVELPVPEGVNPQGLAVLAL